MPTYFLAKIRYRQPVTPQPVGRRKTGFAKTKTVTESYLLDAVSFTDAETRTYRVVSETTPTYEITHINRYPLSDLLRHQTGEKWYRAKVQFILENQKTGKQKKVGSVVLINAATPEEATARLHEKTKTYVTPYELKAIEETAILDVIDYVPAL